MPVARGWNRACHCSLIEAAGKSYFLSRLKQSLVFVLTALDAISHFFHELVDLFEFFAELAHLFMEAMNLVLKILDPLAPFQIGWACVAGGRILSGRN